MSAPRWLIAPGGRLTRVRIQLIVVVASLSGSVRPFGGGSSEEANSHPSGCGHTFFRGNLR